MAQSSDFKHRQNKRIVKDFDFSAGINSQIDAGLMMSRESYSIQNMEVLTRGGLSKRPGLRKYAVEYVDSIVTHVEPGPLDYVNNPQSVVYDTCFGNLKFDPDIVNCAELYGPANNSIRDIFNRINVYSTEGVFSLHVEVRTYVPQEGKDWAETRKWVTIDYINGGMVKSSDGTHTFTNDIGATVTLACIVSTAHDGTDIFIAVEDPSTGTYSGNYGTLKCVSVDTYPIVGDEQVRKSETVILIAGAKSGFGFLNCVGVRNKKGITTLGPTGLPAYKTGIYDAQEVGLNILDQDPTADLVSEKTSPNLQNVAILFDKYGVKKGSTLTMQGYYNYNQNIKIKHHHYFLGPNPVIPDSGLDMTGLDTGWAAWGSGDSWLDINVSTPTYAGITSNVGSEGFYLFRTIMKDSDATDDVANYRIQYTTYQVFTAAQGLNIEVTELHKILLSCGAMEYHKGRLWLGGSPDYPNIYFYSDINNPSYFPAYNFEILPFNADDRISVFKKFKDNLLIFGNRKTFVISGYSTNPDSPDYIKSKCVDEELGIAAKHSIQQLTGNSLMYLTEQGIVLMKPDTYNNADFSKLIIKFVDSKIKSLLNIFKSNWQYASSSSDTNKYYLRFGVVEVVYNLDVAGEPSNGEVASWAYNVNYNWITEYTALEEKYREPYDIFNLPNLQGTLYNISNGKELHTLCLTTGQLYTNSKMDVNPIYTDDGTHYWTEWFSSDLTLGIPDYKKKIKKINFLLMQKDGHSYKAWADIWVGGVQAKSSKHYVTEYYHEGEDDYVSTKELMLEDGNILINPAIRFSEDSNGNPTPDNWVLGSSSFLSPGVRGLPVLVEVRATGKCLTLKARLRELGPNPFVVLGCTTVMKDGKPKGIKSK